MSSELRVLREDLDLLVSVSCWQGGSFEFAHYTDEEFAESIMDLYGDPNSARSSQLVTGIAQLRRRAGNLKGLSTGFEAANL